MGDRQRRTACDMPELNSNGSWNPFSLFGRRGSRASLGSTSSDPSRPSRKPGHPLLALGLRPPKPDGEADVWTNLPLHGVWFIPSPPHPVTGIPTPQATQLPGEIEVRIPKGGRRIKGVRLIRRTFCCLNMGKGREEEIDILDETIQNLTGELTLKEGLHRLEFRHEVPKDLPPTDAVFEALPPVGTYIFGQVIGAEPEDPPIHPLLDISNVPFQERPPGYELDQDGVHVRQEDASEKLPWLEKTISSWRILLLKADPGQSGEPTRLDDRFSAFVPELGLVEGRCFAPNFTVGGPLVARVSIPSPSAKATIISVRMLIAETETVTSPRDKKVVKKKKFGTFLTIGTMPPKGAKLPDMNQPSLWQGTAAGGQSTSGWEMTKHGRFPPSWDTRWSTIPGSEGPVKVEHELISEVYFTVLGEDESGRRISAKAPGEIRIVRRSLKVIMPSCSLLPGYVDLPEYPQSDQVMASPDPCDPDRTQETSLIPCPVCKLPPVAKLCKTCSDSIMPHIIHSEKHPDYCAACAGKTLLPRDLPTGNTWRCACSDRDIWAKEGEKDEGLRMPVDAVPAGTDGAGSMAWVRGRDEMLAVKLDSEWGSK